MNILLNWLKKEPSWKGVMGLVIIYTIMNYVLISMILIVFSILGIKFPVADDAYIQYLISLFPVKTFWNAFREEVFCRFIPLVVVVKSFYPKTLFVMIICSVIFGWQHGGFIFVFGPGITGILLSLLFLKCGGFQGKCLKPLIITSVAHFLSNSFILFIYGIN